MSGKRIKAFDVFLTVFLSCWAVIIVLPFYSAVMVSLVPKSVYLRNSFILYPKNFTLNSYELLFKTPIILTGLKNSIIVVAFGLIISMFLTTSIAYGLSKPIFPGRNIIFNLIIFTMFFGGGLVPYYMLIKSLGMYNSLMALIIPGSLSTFNMLLIKNYIQSLPRSINESAEIDGANDIVIMWNIILPLCMPILATVALFVSVGKWNDWFGPMLFISSREKMTLQIILKNMLSTLESAKIPHDVIVKRNVNEEGVKMACLTVVTLPVLLFYPFAQKYFVKGIMIGSIKA